MGSGGWVAAAAAGSGFCSSSAKQKRNVSRKIPSNLLLRFDLDFDLGLVFGQIAVVVGRDLDGGALAVRDVDHEAVLDLVAEPLVLLLALLAGTNLESDRHPVCARLDRPL